MNGPAKDAYHAYHTALGTVASAPAFEELSMREAEAWANVAGVSRGQLAMLEGALFDVRDREAKIEDYKDEIHRSKLVIEGLEDELKALKAAKEPAAP